MARGEASVFVKALRAGVLACAAIGCSNGSGTIQVIDPDSGAGRDGGIDAAHGDVASGVDGAAHNDLGASAGDTGIDTHTDTGAGAMTDGASDGGDGAVCGDTRFDVHAVPSNVLILLDRSCSMKNSPANATVTEASGMSKWSIAAAAIESLTTSYPSQVRWGMIYLPRSGTADAGVSCAADAVCGGTTTCPEVPPAPGMGPTINTLLASGISPFVGCGHGTQVAITPLNQGLLAAGMVTELHDTTRSDYVMLITDGEETCVGMAAVVATVTSLRTAGVRTAVVGFGATGSGGVNPTELSAMATAGGLPASGTTTYYAANDASSLQSALTQIVGATIGCTFSLGAAPANLALLEVYANATTEIPRDTTHATGWDYNPTTESITLYGSVCAAIQSLRYSQLDVIQACPGGMSTPPPPACHHLGQTCMSNQDCCNLEGLSCDTLHGVCISSPG